MYLHLFKLNWCVWKINLLTNCWLIMDIFIEGNCYQIPIHFRFFSQFLQRDVAIFRRNIQRFHFSYWRFNIAAFILTLFRVVFLSVPYFSWDVSLRCMQCSTPSYTRILFSEYILFSWCQRFCRVNFFNSCIHQIIIITIKWSHT